MEGESFLASIFFNVHTPVQRRKCPLCLRKSYLMPEEPHI